MLEAKRAQEENPRSAIKASAGIAGKRVAIFGIGKVGNALIAQIPHKVEIVRVVRSGGVFDDSMQKIAERKDWKEHMDGAEVAFITIPSIGTGEEAYAYAMHFLRQGGKVVTCEKAAIAHHGEELDSYGDSIRYSASVGGSTRMPAVLAAYQRSNKVFEIKAVVNGTLNYLSEHALEKGGVTEGFVAKMVDDGYAEPGATSFEALIKGEMNDIKYKAAILGNRSGIFKKQIFPEDVYITEPRPEDFSGGSGARRAIVKIDKHGVHAGFREDTRSLWLPDGVNNVLVVNGEQIAHGPGAGQDKTAGAMMEDFREFFSSNTDTMPQAK